MKFACMVGSVADQVRSMRSPIEGPSCGKHRHVRAREVLAAQAWLASLPFVAISHFRSQEAPMRKPAIASIVSMELAAIAVVPATAQIAPSSRYAQHTAVQATGQLQMDAVPDLEQDNIRKVQQALEEKKGSVWVPSTG
jgi:hypothetical protein